MIARKPAVAGSFYPAQPDRLWREVVELLADAENGSENNPQSTDCTTCGLHLFRLAAAAAFATLRGSAQTFTRIVLIGPAHYVAIRGIALPTVDAFETLLGRVSVDRDALNEITGLPFVSRNDAAHAPEHALEVELPFLQIVLPSFSLLPLVVGGATMAR